MVCALNLPTTHIILLLSLFIQLLNANQQFKFHQESSLRTEACQARRNQWMQVLDQLTSDTVNKSWWFSAKSGKFAKSVQICGWSNVLLSALWTTLDLSSQIMEHQKCASQPRLHWKCELFANIPFRFIISCSFKRLFLFKRNLCQLWLELPKRKLILENNCYLEKA